MIETHNDEEGLARTLVSLVGAAVQGIVRDVVVCDAGSTDGTRHVADHAGCTLAGKGLAAGLAAARGEWLLFLEPGARLTDGWTEEVTSHMANHTTPARFSPAGARLPAFLTGRISRRGLHRGLLISRSQVAAFVGSAANAEELARRVSKRTLRAEIWPASADKAQSGGR